MRLYRVIDGKRIEFVGTDVKVTPGQWHRLGLGIVGMHFKVSFDDKPVLFEADDATLTKTGQVGLWTKADSVTEFDGLIVSQKD